MGTVRILVVDDAEVDATVVRDHLITQEYDVEVLHDPREAWDKIMDENGFDLLVFDVNLPWIDGLTLTKRLRGEGVLTPVLLLSGGVSSDVKLTITTMGPSVSFLEKSGGKELLLAACSDLLSRNQLMRLVYKMNDRMGSLEKLLLDKIPTSEEITEISRTELTGHCPRMHSQVKEEVHHSRTDAILQVEESFRAEVQEATHRLAEKIEKSTDITNLFSKAKSHPLIQAMSGLLAVILAGYLGLTGYSYKQSSENSKQVIEIKSELKRLGGKIDNQSHQMQRIEALLVSHPNKIPYSRSASLTTTGSSLP